MRGFSGMLQYTSICILRQVHTVRSRQRLHLPFVIAGVKRGLRNLTDPWTEPSKRNVEKVLSASRGTGRCSSRGIQFSSFLPRYPPSSCSSPNGVHGTSPSETVLGATFHKSAYDSVRPDPSRRRERTAPPQDKRDLPFETALRDASGQALRTSSGRRAAGATPNRLGRTLRG
jgi:hypothetical protein